MSVRLFVFFSALLLSSNNLLNAQVKFYGKDLVIGKNIEILKDKDNQYKANDLLTAANFVQATDATPNLGMDRSTYWIRFAITNNSNDKDLVLDLAYPLIDSSALYIFDNPLGEYKPAKDRLASDSKPTHQNVVYGLEILPGQTQRYLVKITGPQIVLPVIIRSEEGFLSSSLDSGVLMGIYVGLLAVMMLYNLFVYFSVREKSYLYYVFYILFIGLAQITITGFAYKYFWPSAPYASSTAVVYFSALSGVFAVVFFKDFLHTKEKLPAGEKYLNIVVVLYVLAVTARLLNFPTVSFRLLDVAGIAAAVSGLTIAWKISRQRYRPAKFFLVAWTSFLSGLFLFVLRNLNILPYNMFTSYTMQAGTAIEVVLLSFALADKINILKKEKEASQAAELRASQENERIIKEQNVILEHKVEERTVELRQTNVELSDTLTKLKDAQTQLIESEKMASLGQLTAGIAHEINNPINFVSSNIKPLKRDIDDLLEILDSYDGLKNIDELDGLKAGILKVEKLKDDIDLDYIKGEMDLLLKGMEDGASRTVEIIRGLKNFSRIDESDSNFVNVNEGLESTLVILNNQMGGRINLVKDFGGLPNINCYAGKLNQVFMNILTNSIDAVNEPLPDNRQRTIWVKTRQAENDKVTISIKDNGPGMSPEVKSKIFDPFFTTKDVGKGTGLGLSIVFKIIEAHKGNITVTTKEGEGTEFLITLPVSNN